MGRQLYTMRTTKDGTLFAAYKSTQQRKGINMITCTKEDINTAKRVLDKDNIVVGMRAAARILEKDLKQVQRYIVAGKMPPHIIDVPGNTKSRVIIWLRQDVLDFKDCLQQKKETSKK